MNDNGWVVVAKVGESVAAKRTDSCGDMEQLEVMELILVSSHDTKEAAQQAAAKQADINDGWRYAVPAGFRDQNSRESCVKAAARA